MRNSMLKSRFWMVVGAAMFFYAAGGMNACAQDEAKPAITAKQGTDIGSFDIGKVAELSKDPRATMPQTGAMAPEAAKKERTNLVFTLLRIIGSLAVIVALILGVSWLLRKAGLAGSSRAGGGGSMDVLEVLPFGQNRNVVMFRVMDTVYVCGQTPGSISLIDKIEGPRAVELLTSSKGPSTVVKFKDAFNHFVSRIKK